jgi:hypothetical protein
MGNKAIRCVTVALATCLGLTQLTSPAAAATKTSPNLIRNASAEHTTPKPTDYGDKVTVTAWTVAKRYDFTAGPYGAPSFPGKHDVGPKGRGKNFFAGGTDGRKSIATQVDSLADYVPWVKAGKAHFTLSGWLGGYSSQADRATLQVTWRNQAGKHVGTAKIGPVTHTSRHDTTSLLHRSTNGTVPKSARTALFTLTMTRTDGTYNDGYADKLKLVIAKS